MIDEGVGWALLLGIVGLARAGARVLFLGAMVGLALGAVVGAEADDPANATVRYETDGDRRAIVAAPLGEPIEISNGSTNASTTQSPYGPQAGQFATGVNERVGALEDAVVPERVQRADDAFDAWLSRQLLGGMFRWIAHCADVTAGVAVHLPTAAATGAGILAMVSVAGSYARRLRNRDPPGGDEA